MNERAGNEEISNRLGEESSLYLRQHADNPVAWQPWDDAALALARKTARPILLSIGYSACHWCHVMAHESFEDEATARVMNELYINIKVDREERPDLDKIYQLSHQLLTGRGGGWPLTLFIEPRDLTPFFAGTYFPLEARYGMPAFREVLVRARQWFEQNPDEVKTQGERLQDAIQSIQRAPGDRAPETDQDPKESACKALLGRFDRQHGGYGGAPKFPQAPLLELAAILDCANPDQKSAVEQSLHFTLETMANSGLRDHLDGGFFRYCVDGSWTIPHFEKMLYDNAQLLPLYAIAAATTGRDRFRFAAEGIVEWLEQEMLQDNGGFSASIDADADGEEGGFHVWRREQVRELLTEAEYAAFAAAYGLESPPNFEGEAWHLVRTTASGQEALLAGARSSLAKARERRVHPTLDRKQLTSWNALTASGLLRAARALERDDWAEMAHNTLDFIRETQWDGARLLAVHNQGESRFAGYLDDYAFTLQALLESLRTDWRREDLDFALKVADALLQRFSDQHDGGFFFSDADQATPIARSVSAQDDAIPSGYAIAAGALRELAALVGETRYLEAADKALDRARPEAVQSPLGFATLTRALIGARQPLPQVVIRALDEKDGHALKFWAESQYSIHCYLLAETDDNPLPGLLAEFRSAEPLTAWVCQGMTCLPPAHSREALQGLLEQPG